MPPANTQVEVAMKKRALMMAGLIALTVMASTRTARAQEMLVENIPFAFVAGNQALPAGACAVNAASPTHPLLLINCRSPDDSRFLNTSADVAKDFQSQPKLVFSGIADRYSFSQVWNDGNSRGGNYRSPRAKRNDAAPEN